MEIPIDTFPNIPPRHLNIFEREYANGYPLHLHTFYEIELILEGSATHVLNGTPHTVKRGDAFLLNPVSIHAFEPDGAVFRMLTIMIPFESMQSQVLSAITAEKMPLSVSLSDEMLQHILFIVAQLRASGGKPYVHRGAHIAHYIPITPPVSAGLEWLISCLATDATVRSKEAVSLRMQPVLAYLQNHFMQDVSLAAAARIVCLSPEYFSRQFKAEFGENFQSYLLRLRLRFAKRLLTLSDTPVSKVSESAGFHTTEYFSRAFKKVYGISPQSLRTAQSK